MNTNSEISWDITPAKTDIASDNADIINGNTTNSTFTADVIGDLIADNLFKNLYEPEMAKPEFTEIMNKH